MNSSLFLPDLAKHWLWGFRALFEAYVFQIFAFSLFTWWPSPFTFIVCFLVVGIRSHAIGILTHETFHNSLFPSPAWNDFVGRYLGSYPLIGRFTAPKEEHLNHHSSIGNSRDPDYFNYDWPVDSQKKHLWYLLRSMTGASFCISIVQKLKSIFAPMPTGHSQKTGKRSSSNGEAIFELSQILLCQLVIFGLFALTIGWQWYPLLWIWPLVSVGRTVNHLRIFLEHRRKSLRVFSRATFFERWIFSHCNFNRHGFHHLKPHLPFWKVDDDVVASHQ